MKPVLILAAIVAAALALRAVSLGDRPVHHDEANQAVRCGDLLEAGRYRFDPTDHHGPTLYYFVLPFLHLQSGGDFAATTIEAYRILSVLAGVALVLAPLLMRRALGTQAVLWTALLTAVSPALVYFSRFFIHEMLFVLFACLFLGGIWRCARGGTWRSAILTGVAAGLLQATKESSVIVFGCAAVAGVVTLLAHHAMPAGRERTRWRKLILTAAAAGLVTSILLYSSLLTHWQGVADAVRAYGALLWRAGGSGVHVHPWHYYVHMLAFWRHGQGPVWSEAGILVLALVGACRILAGRVPHPAWGRFLLLYTLLLWVVFSLSPYKTPWNICALLHAAVLLAGVGATAVVGQGPLWRRAGGWAAVLAVVAHLGWQAWRGALPMSSDPRNPYVYAHTSRDFEGAAKRIADAAAIHPAGRSLRIDVISSVTDQWPLPWYLRGFNQVGYYPPEHLPEEPDLPVIVSTVGVNDALEAWMGNRYITGLWQLRPGTFVCVSVRVDLMEQIAASRPGAATPAP